MILIYVFWTYGGNRTFPFVSKSKHFHFCGDSIWAKEILSFREWGNIYTSTIKKQLFHYFMLAFVSSPALISFQYVSDLINLTEFIAWLFRPHLPSIFPNTERDPKSSPTAFQNWIFPWKLCISFQGEWRPFQGYLWSTFLPWALNTKWYHHIQMTKCKR